jgi:hypothetical protein
VGRLAKALGFATLAVAAFAHAQESIPASQAPEGTIEIREPVTIPGTRVEAVLPDEFSLSESFAGLEHDLMGTTVVFTELARPLEEIQEWVDSDTLKARGMRRVNVQDLVIPAGDAELYHVKEDAEPIELYRWILLVDGGDNGTLLVVVTTHQDNETRLRPSVLALFDALRWDPEKPLDPFADLSFRVDPIPPLIFSPRLSEHLGLMRADQMGPIGQGDPRAFVSKHSVATGVEDLARHAHEHLQLTDQTSTLETLSERTSQLGGLPAYEIVAHGRDFEHMTPLVVYQVVALDGEDYYVVQGFVARSEADAYLPRFRKLAQSFRRSR